ncbi:hypothetical protein [Nonomuraea sp. NPDC052265]|uniref:hypothetical protein n=1 Tax=Nonomuraea sp. NPDC052265 TaxID=3364374 RepID=UPI0037C83A9B
MIFAVRVAEALKPSRYALPASTAMPLCPLPTPGLIATGDQPYLACAPATASRAWQGRPVGVR